MESQSTLTGYIRQSLQTNWDRDALSDFRGNTLRYCDVALAIAKLHIVFERAGIVRGDKIAIVGRNCSHWALAALASLTYGTVTVPILHDFKPDTLHHLIQHCEAKLLFVDGHIWKALDHEHMPHLKGAANIADYSLLYSRNKELTEAVDKLNKHFGDKYPHTFGPADVNYPDFSADDLALINYTSGSMGFSKGVMLSYESLWSNIQFSIDGLNFLYPGDGMVSMLPLAHMYGFSFEFLHPFVKGCHIVFLTRTPSPKIIMEAFAQVKPKLIIAVPLILEKIVKSRVFPQLNKPLVRLALHLPVVRGKILAKVKAQMDMSFGGNLKEFIIGGASLSKDVEAFLRSIRFPYTVGYGMTECGPLISYAPWNVNRPGSCGRLIDRMEIRVDSPDPATTPGLIWVRGANVMKGYFNNADATKAAFGPDGWMNTGDLGQIDADGFIYIRGRDKNMILGPSGQNIYPEEIEQQLNNLPLVGESLVVSRSDKLVALVRADVETIENQHLPAAKVDEQMRDNLRRLNASLPAFSQVAEIKLMDEDFEKTPKRSIKRYLYQ